MAIATLEEFIAYGRDSMSGSNTIEAQLALDAAEEAVCDFCARQFTLATGTPSVRRFRVANPSTNMLAIDDCVSVTTVSDNGATISASGYQLEPLNGRNASGDVVPYDSIRRLDASWSWSFDGEALVSITADWGWAEIPSRVKQAVLITAKDVYQQRNTTAGVVGVSDFGPIRARLNPVALQLLKRLRRSESFGVA